MKTTDTSRCLTLLVRRRSVVGVRRPGTGYRRVEIVEATAYFGRY